MRAEGEKWSSGCSVPGKSERSVWVAKAPKVKYALCSKFLTCYQLFRGKRPLRCKQFWDVCRPGGPLSPAAGACGPWRSPGEEPGVMLRPCCVFRACCRGQRLSPARSSCWQLCRGKASALLSLYIPPPWRCCRRLCRTTLRNITPDWKL